MDSCLRSLSLPLSSPFVFLPHHCVTPIIFFFPSFPSPQMCLARLSVFACLPHPSLPVTAIHSFALFLILSQFSFLCHCVNLALAFVFTHLPQFFFLTAASRSPPSCVCVMCPKTLHYIFSDVFFYIVFHQICAFLALVYSCFFFSQSIFWKTIFLSFLFYRYYFQLFIYVGLVFFINNLNVFWITFLANFLFSFPFFFVFFLFFCGTFSYRFYRLSIFTSPYLHSFFFLSFQYLYILFPRYLSLLYIGRRKVYIIFLIFFVCICSFYFIFQHQQITFPLYIFLYSLLGPLTHQFYTE